MSCQLHLSQFHRKTHRKIWFEFIGVMIAAVVFKAESEADKNRIARVQFSFSIFTINVLFYHTLSLASDDETSVWWLYHLHKMIEKIKWFVFLIFILSFVSTFVSTEIHIKLVGGHTECINIINYSSQQIMQDSQYWNETDNFVVFALVPLSVSCFRSVALPSDCFHL